MTQVAQRETVIAMSSDIQQELHQCALDLAQERLPDGWQRVASSVSARVAYSEQRRLYFKEFLPRSPVESMKAAVMGSRATRARKNSEALLHNGIDAPVNVAWGKLPHGREYLFTEAVEGQGITTWLRQALVQRSGPELQQRRQLLHQLGTFIGRVHATGFIHGDLRTSNVLAQWHGQHFRFALIDNERNQQISPPPGKALLKNLMQLNMLLPSDLSQTDRMRFFVEWRRQMRDLAPLEAKLLAADAYHWAMRRLYDKGKL
jgi:hypothetical protein